MLRAAGKPVTFVMLTATHASGNAFLMATIFIILSIALSLRQQRLFVGVYHGIIRDMMTNRGVHPVMFGSRQKTRAST